MVARRHRGEPAPFALGAFNDCSIRRPNARKISEKKNWGPASKGVAYEFFEAHDLTPDGPTATLRLLCHLRTADGVHHEYGVDSPLLGYSYYGEVLLDWIVERLANQKGSPETPFGGRRRAAGRRRPPSHVLIGIGATRYTSYGESTYLKPGDGASCGCMTLRERISPSSVSWSGSPDLAGFAARAALEHRHELFRILGRERRLGQVPGRRG